MKLNILTLTFAILMTAGSFSPLNSSNLPRSKQATLIESSNPAEVMVYAGGTGYWKDGMSRDRDRENFLLNSAEEDARKSAVYFVLLGGSTPLLTTEQEKTKFNAIAEEFFEIDNIMQFIAWEGTDLLKRTKRVIEKNEEYELLIEKAIKINKTRIKQDLINRGVMQGNLAEELGLPVIMVLPDVPKGKSPVEELQKSDLAQGATVIKEYLTTKRYEVVVPSQQLDVSNMTSALNSMGDVEEDYSYQIALSVGSDIYITYKINIEDDKYSTKKAIVNVSAFETTTSRLLGASTGYSPSTQDPPGVLIESAVSDAIDKVLNMINAYWKEDLQKGIQYKLVVNIASDFDRREVTDITDIFGMVLDEITKDERYKENIATAQTLDYLIWCDPEKFSKSSKVSRKIRSTFEDEFDDGVIFEVNRTSKLIVLKVEME